MPRLLAVLTIALGLFAATGHAAEAPADKGGVSADNLENLVQTLEDPGRRELLLQDLRTLLKAKREADKPAADPGLGAELLEHLSERVGAVSRQLAAAATAVVDLPRFLRAATNTLQDGDRREEWFLLVGRIALVLLAGIAASLIVRRALARPLEAIESRADDAVGLTLALLLARTLLDLLPVAGFAAAAFGALTLFGPEGPGRVAAVALIDASVIVRIVAALARMVLAPFVAGLRLFPLGDETANYLYVWVRRLTILTVYGYFIAQAALLLGLPAAIHNTAMKLLGLAVGLLLIMVTLQNRHEVGAIIRGDGNGPLPALRRRLADIWHILFIAYLFCGYAVWALEIRGGFEFVSQATALTVAIFVVARILELVMRRGVQRAFALGRELSIRLPGLEARANRYLALIETTARTTLYVLVGLAVLQVWGLDVYSWLAAPAGRTAIGRAVTVALIVIAAIVAWEIVSALVERNLTATDENGNAIARSQRIRTLLPLLRNAFMVVLIVLATMTALSELGLNIAPLLAGAGVVGLAVGFGAQTLVKDVITGLFILIEDTISVGDVVTVAGHGGVVEAVTIRTIRLRDLSGTVHVIPFSEVTSIENLTRDFAYALLDIGIAYREDADAVIEVIRELGAEIRKHPEYEAKIVADIEILGLDRFDDSAVVIRARIKTLPLQQWSVKRGFNLMMKRRFDELGIEIPFPHQTIYFGEDKEGNAPPAPVRLMQDVERARRTGATETAAADGPTAPAAPNPR
jgi:small-conductance mechanosensitive channel